jgi:class 3 adenylate cyclase
VFVASLRAVQATDVSEEARNVRAETMILFPNSAGLPPHFAQQTASRIPHSTLRSVDQSLPAISDDGLVDLVLRFFAGSGASTKPTEQASTTAIILFADIADSTALTERLGDAAFRDKARELDEALRRAITSNGGTAIDGKLLGDGVLATFGAAREAIACSAAIHDAGSHAGLPLHVGIHAGDVIRENDPDGRSNVFGGAVNIAARIADQSAAGETLVSATVRELARTSAGVSFEDRGERELKGVSEPVRVFAVREGGAQDA